MRYRWPALAGIVLTLVFMPREGFAQQPPTAERTAPQGRLEQNYPNPFNQDTRGLFYVADAPTCSAPEAKHRVTVKIYNILAQLVATPVLQGDSGSVAGGQKLENVPLPCGQYTWYWDGNHGGTHKEAAPGVYVVIETVDGVRMPAMKMTVAKK
jgi:hypothetical protein